MIEITGVRKAYGDVVALAGVTARFASGRTTVLIGPSGCGKSTLLRALIGLVQPDAGEVRIDGTEVSATTVRALRHRTGYVIQSGGLFPHLTAEQNVNLAARHLGWRPGDIRERVEEVCELVRFPVDRLGAWPGELSGGQRQRVSLGRALMLRPELLLLDEPLGALDPMIRAELQDELRELFRRLGRTVVFVTHDLAEAVHFADRIVLMRAGKIVQAGTIGDLTERPAEDFVGDFVATQRRLHREMG